MLPCWSRDETILIIPGFQFTGDHVSHLSSLPFGDKAVTARPSWLYVTKGPSSPLFWAHLSSLGIITRLCRKRRTSAVGRTCRLTNTCELKTTTQSLPSPRVPEPGAGCTVSSPAREACGQRPFAQPTRLERASTVPWAQPRGQCSEERRDDRGVRSGRTRQLLSPTAASLGRSPARSPRSEFLTEHRGRIEVKRTS